VNCDDHQHLCSQHGVRSFPVIKAFVPGQAHVQEFVGERSAKGMTDWALGLIPAVGITPISSKAQVPISSKAQVPIRSKAQVPISSKAQVPISSKAQVPGEPTFQAVD
jgi:thioredoxin-like negative regulator of GroEL